jgi:plasmid replication initiation protein
VSNLPIVPSKTADKEQCKRHQTAVQAAIVESAKNLSPDEQFLIAATLKKLVRSLDRSPRNFSTVRVSVAAFAKHAKVDAVTAKQRLEAASARLFRRSCSAFLEDPENAGADLKFRWIDSVAVGDSYVKFNWTHIFAGEFVRAVAAAKSIGSKKMLLSFLPEGSAKASGTRASMPVE